MEKLAGWFEVAEPTLFRPLSQDWRLARIWLSTADTHESLSSRLWASKCQVCPVNDTMMKSAFSSSVGGGSEVEQSQRRFAGARKPLMVTGGEQKRKRSERSDGDKNRNSFLTVTCLINVSQATKAL